MLYVATFMVWIATLNGVLKENVSLTFGGSLWCLIRPNIAIFFKVSSLLQTFDFKVWVSGPLGVWEKCVVNLFILTKCLLILGVLPYYVKISCLLCSIEDSSSLNSNNIPKIQYGRNNCLLYFFRVIVV